MVPRVELLDHGLVIRMRPLPTIEAGWRALHERKRDDRALRRASLGARPSLDEHADRAAHFLGRVQVALVGAKFRVGVAHHHRAVAREPNPRDALETELTQTDEKFIAVARNRSIECQLELRRIDAPAKEARQRLKHFVGPGTKSLSDCDHTSVATSILSSERRMLFTDEGRPPRMRFETVPAVEITVPFFVCSM